MGTNELPLVSIQCLVYNHEPYLRQCLDGFVMQKTNFKFEAIVHDDVSSDRSVEIIREYAEKYPEIIKPIYETVNQYSKGDGSLDKIMNNACKGKYIAFCEGDDFWIDPYKLQKQVDILESSQLYGLCYTRTHVLNQKLNKMEPYTFGYNAYNPLKDIFTVGNFIPTTTVLCRRSLILKYIKDINPQSQHWLMGDLPMWIWFIINSKIMFLDETTSVYRLLENSASHSNDIHKQEIFNESAMNIRLFFLNYYRHLKIDKNNVRDLYFRTMLDYGEKHNKRIYCINMINKINNQTRHELLKKYIYRIPEGIMLFTILIRIKSILLLMR